MCLSPEGLRSLRGLEQLRKCVLARGQAGDGTQRPFQLSETGDPGGAGRGGVCAGREDAPPSLSASLVFFPSCWWPPPGWPGFVLLINALLDKYLEERGFCSQQPAPHPPWHTVGTQPCFPMGLWLPFQGCPATAALRTPCQVLTGSASVPALQIVELSRSAPQFGGHNAKIK